jgi:hypothetical protein
MKRKMRKSAKSRLNRYTALVPKTLKATKSVGTSVVKKINYFLNNTAKTIKKSTKILDKTAAKSIKSIYSLTKRRNRK